MTRRGFVALAGMAAAGSDDKSVMAVEGYIFQQYAQSLHRPLPEIIPDVLRMSKSAGFHNIELNPAFFPAGSEDRTLAMLREENLRMPSMYVGGPLHERQQADRTIASALKFAELCRPLGCRAIVNNPDPKPGGQPKTDPELNEQAEALNHMGRALTQKGFDLRIHHHTPQLENNAREWRHILAHTDPEYVHICVDVDWAYEGGFEPVPFLQEVGPRLREIHVRSARNKVWLEDLEDSDIDYRKVNEYLRAENLSPLIVVELAYRPNTVVTRPLEEDLRLSLLYAETIFGNRA